MADFTSEEFGDQVSQAISGIIAETLTVTLQYTDDNLARMSYDIQPSWEDQLDWWRQHAFPNATDEEWKNDISPVLSSGLPIPFESSIPEEDSQGDSEDIQFIELNHGDRVANGLNRISEQDRVRREQQRSIIDEIRENLHERLTEMSEEERIRRAEGLITKLKIQEMSEINKVRWQTCFTILSAAMREIRMGSLDDSVKIPTMTSFATSIASNFLIPYEEIFRESAKILDSHIHMDTDLFARLHLHAAHAVRFVCKQKVLSLVKTTLKAYNRSKN